MYSIYDQINNRKVLVYKESQTEIDKTIDSVKLTNKRIASTYFPEDIDPVPLDIKKVEIGEGNFLYNGDNMEVLKTLPDNSIDSCVTDPPYGLKFMGKNWDEDVPTVELWKEVFRVLKPGGYLLSFGSPRTYHRMATRIEEAGFEIRDQIMWVYGSGFPKSQNISKSIDKKYGRLGLDIKEIKTELKDLYILSGKSMKVIDEECGFKASGYLRIKHRDDDGWGNALPTSERWQKISTVINCDKEKFEKLNSYFKNAEREMIGIGKAVFFEKNNVFNLIDDDYGNYEISKSKTNEGQIWEGWGTNLKPAHEPICMARKPIEEKCIVENVLKWGTGGINIDSCRVYSEARTEQMFSNDEREDQTLIGLHSTMQHQREKTNLERFPANIIFDKEAGEILDQQSGLTSQGHWPKSKTTGFGNFGYGETIYYGVGVKDKIKGGASRFFYCPKPSKKERNEGMPFEIEQFSKRPRRDDGSVIYKESHPEEWEMAMSKLKRKDKTTFAAAEEKLQGKTYGLKNNHPTIKPVKLMEYLIKLVTPIGGTLIDPFFGSGTSGKSILNDNKYKFIGIEKNEEYFKIAHYRCINEYNKSKLLAA